MRETWSDGTENRYSSFAYYLYSRLTRQQRPNRHAHDRTYCGHREWISLHRLAHDSRQFPCNVQGDAGRHAVSPTYEKKKIPTVHVRCLVTANLYLIAIRRIRNVHQHPGNVDAASCCGARRLLYCSVLFPGPATSIICRIDSTKANTSYDSHNLRKHLLLPRHVQVMRAVTSQES